MTVPKAAEGVATDQTDWRLVLTLSAPVIMGYVPLGTVFGFLFVQAGGSWWLALLSSVLVYAGAAQFMMIPMLGAGLPVTAIAAATLVVNLRHVFYGLSLLGKMPPSRAHRAYLMYALTDETYSVLTTMPEHTPPRVMVWIAALNQAWWVLGTGLGAMIGAQAQVPLVGLDFALTALFAVLMVAQWQRSHAWWPLWLAVLAYALAWWWVPAHALVIAMGVCVLAALGVSAHE